MILGKLDYYEAYDHFRRFNLDSEVQFVFGLKIVPNSGLMIGWKDPPGENIKEPMIELIYYT
jgi:hypothetical protein